MPIVLRLVCLSLLIVGCYTKQPEEEVSPGNPQTSDTADDNLDTGQALDDEESESDVNDPETEQDTETDSGTDTSSSGGSSSESLLSLSVSGLSSPLPATGTSGSLVLTTSTEQPGEIVDVNVTFDLDHTCTKDLSLSLLSPAGTLIELFDLSTYPVCSSDMENTILDDEASQSIDSGSNPYTGTFRPAEPLANFDGEEPAGTWTIEFQDAVTGDSGRIYSFTIDIFYLSETD